MSKSLDHSFNVKAKSFWPPYYKDVSKTLSYLFTNPALLHEALDVLTDLFCSYASDAAMMDDTVLCLTNQLVETDNVQYIGALCCVHLSNNVFSEENNAVFKTSFLSRLTKMHNHFKSTGYQDDESFNFLYLLTDFALQNSESDIFDFIFRAIISSLACIIDHSQQQQQQNQQQHQQNQQQQQQSSSLPPLKCIHRVIKMSRLQLCKKCPQEFEQLSHKLREAIIDDATPQQHRRQLLETAMLMVLCRASHHSTSHSSPSDHLLDEFQDLNLSNGTGSLSGEPPSNVVVSYGVTIFKDEDETYIMPNEEVDPEMYEDFENFLGALDGMDEQAEEAFEGFLADCKPPAAAADDDNLLAAGGGVGDDLGGGRSNHLAGGVGDDLGGAGGVGNDVAAWGAGGDACDGGVANDEGNGGGVGGNDDGGWGGGGGGYDGGADDGGDGGGGGGDDGGDS